MKVRFSLLWLALCLVMVSGAAQADELPESAYISGVSGHAQAYVLSCEARSAADWAAYYGVSLSESDFLGSLPRSDNPDEGFVGQPNDAWGNLPPNGYGVHADPVAELLQDYGLEADARRNLSWEALRAEVAAGRPVIVWVIGQMWTSQAVEYTADDGETATVARFEHTMILIGYTPEVVHVVDAYSGSTQTYALGSFIASWGVLGNMAVIYTGECCAAAPTPAPGGESYTVQAGDYLTALAERFGTTWEELARLNDIPYPYTIYAGQQLRLPGVQPEAAEATAAPEEPVTPVSPLSAANVLSLPLILRSEGGVSTAATALEAPASYTVQAGDSLFSLGRLFGLDWREIAAHNGLDYPFVIFASQVLEMP